MRQQYEGVLETDNLLTFPQLNILEMAIRLNYCICPAFNPHCKLQTNSTHLYITQLLHNPILEIWKKEKNKILELLPWQTLYKYQTFSTRSDPTVPSILIRLDVLIYSQIFVGSWLHLIDSPLMRQPLPPLPVWNPLNKTLVTEQAW